MVFDWKRMMLNPRKEGLGFGQPRLVQKRRHSNGPLEENPEPGAKEAQ